VVFLRDEYEQGKRQDRQRLATPAPLRRASPS
jgi:hypothetical protein